jgi:hypothetical protein
VAISLEKARLIRFARKDGILNRDMGANTSLKRGVRNGMVQMKIIGVNDVRFKPGRRILWLE